MKRSRQKKDKVKTFEMAMRKHIGQRIRERRMAANLKQKELGAVIGVSEGQMSRYERGTNPIPNAALMMLATKLKCEFTDLLQGDQNHGEKHVRRIDQGQIQRERFPR